MGDRILKVISTLKTLYFLLKNLVLTGFIKITGVQNQISIRFVTASFDSYLDIKGYKIFLEILNLFDNFV